MRCVAAVLLALTLTACDGSGPRPTTRETTPETTPPAASSAAPVPGPPLAYATGDAVFALAADGTLTTVARDVELFDLAVSRDGRYVAYVVRGVDFTLGLYDLRTGDARRWTSPEVSASEVEATTEGFVVVDEAAAGRLLVFDPARVVAGGEPEATPITGLRSPRLITARGARVLVGGGIVAGPRGGPETVYDLTSDGRARRLFTDTGNPLRIGAAAITADGTRLVYGTGSGGVTTETECDLSFELVVRSLEDGTRLEVAPMPSLGADVLTVVGDVTTGADGRTVVSVGTELGGCAQEARAAAYVLSGRRWVRLGADTRWAAAGSDGRLATLSTLGALRVDGTRVAADVHRVAWPAA